MSAPSANTTGMRVGYVGLGVMGGALAQRLLLSRPLRVFDLNPASVADLSSRGATPAASLGDMARNCDVVMICVPRSENVREVLFSPDGLADHLAPGSIVVDQTSGDPEQTRAMAAALDQRGVAMLDAPVSGGVRGAEAGTIAIMVGGRKPDLNRVWPVLEAISPNITHCGVVGAGQVLKLINNTISTCNRYALLEGVALGMKNGLDLATMTAVLNAGGARSRASEHILPALTKGESSGRFALSLMLKDLNLASQLAVASGAPMPFGQLARSQLQTAANTLGSDAELDDIARVVAAQAAAQFGGR